MLNRNSRLKEIYATAIGKDVIDKLLLQAKMPRAMMDNPVISNLRIAALKRIFGDKLDDGFIETFLRLLNAEEAVPAPGDCMLTPAWWKGGRSIIWPPGRLSVRIQGSRSGSLPIRSR